MKKTRLVQTALAVSVLSGSFAAIAAEPLGSFVRIDGVAVVSKGAQYVKAFEGMPLSEGDRLMVMEGGKAVLKFADGCQHKLQDNELLTIAALSPCASNTAGTYKVDSYSAVSGSESAALQQAQTFGAGAGAAGSGGAGAAGAAGAGAAGAGAAGAGAGFGALGGGLAGLGGVTAGGLGIAAGVGAIGITSVATDTGGQERRDQGTLTLNDVNPDNLLPLPPSP